MRTAKRHWHPASAEEAFSIRSAKFGIKSSPPRTGEGEACLLGCLSKRAQCVVEELMVFTIRSSDMTGHVKAHLVGD